MELINFKRNSDGKTVVIIKDSLALDFMKWKKTNVKDGEVNLFDLVEDCLTYLALKGHSLTPADYVYITANITTVFERVKCVRELSNRAEIDLKSSAYFLNINKNDI